MMKHYGQEEQFLAIRHGNALLSVCAGEAIKTVSARFYNALRILKAEGIMGDLNDGPEQKPLERNDVEQTILKLLPAGPFDMIISHNPNGEYTRHIRHEETGKAVY